MDDKGQNSKDLLNSPLAVAEKEKKKEEEKQ